jgi:hypothetical protein
MKARGAADLLSGNAARPALLSAGGDQGAGEPGEYQCSVDRVESRRLRWILLLGELDWFIENGKVEIMHKDAAVPPEDIPPYKWNAEVLTKLRLVDLSRLEGLKKKQDRAKERPKAGRLMSASIS